MILLQSGVDTVTKRNVVGPYLCIYFFLYTFAIHC